MTEPLRIAIIDDSSGPPTEPGNADPATCEHNTGWCHHARHNDDPEESGCHECGTTWPFTTCNMTDDEIDAKLDKVTP